LTGVPARLDPAARRSLERVLDLLAADDRSPTTVRRPDEAWDVHVADSLSGLEVPELARAMAIADIGSGAGFPGLALAAAMPAARVDLIESASRKADFIERAIAASTLANATVIAARSEEWAREPPLDGGREAYDAVTARAVGRLAELAELASPLLREGGVLVGWKGARDSEEEEELARRAEAVAMVPERVIAVRPYPSSRNRHLHVIRKLGTTPRNLPRRAGRARKR
jgi:16S rRNA (guanine527-N7)-methyltransferase